MALRLSVLLFLLFSATPAFSVPVRVAEDNPCVDFSVAIDVARNAMKDWKAYPVDTTDESQQSFHVFSHLVDVAHQSFDDCPDRALRDSYYLLAMERALGNYDRDPEPEAALDVSLAAGYLEDLWIDGFAKQRPQKYAEYKGEILRLCKVAHVKFVSPESGKVLVSGEQPDPLSTIIRVPFPQ